MICPLKMLTILEMQLKGIEYKAESSTGMATVIQQAKWCCWHGKWDSARKIKSINITATTATFKQPFTLVRLATSSCMHQAAILNLREVGPLPSLKIDCWIRDFHDKLNQSLHNRYPKKKKKKKTNILL